LKLTDTGRHALPLLTQGFDELAKAVAQMRMNTEREVLTISVSPSFGSMWLVPRLDRFRAQHPEIEIRIDGTDRLVNVTHGDDDVAGRYGPGGYKGVRVDFLFNQRNTPVCSPALLSGGPPLTRPQDLRHHTLLHVDWMQPEASWRMWVLAAGLRDVDATRGPHFTQEEMAVQAALDGQGVALIGDKLIQDHLNAGRLVCPFSPDITTALTFSHYLLTPSGAALKPKVTAFRDWLLNEVRNAFADPAQPSSTDLPHGKDTGPTSRA